MKRTVTLYTITILIIAMSLSSHASLLDRGDGLIYDDDLNLTWLQNSNHAGFTMTWADANTWAEDLIIHGYDDWRLPQFACIDDICTPGEMGHLYSAESITSETPDLFLDVRPSIYWSGTENSGDPSMAYRFNFKGGSDGFSDKTLKKYAWAVREGDTAPPVAPEPISSLLFLTGGATMGIRRYFKT